MKFAAERLCEDVDNILNEFEHILNSPTVCYDHVGQTKEEKLVSSFKQLSFIYLKDGSLSFKKHFDDNNGEFVGCGWIPDSMNTLVVSHCDHVFNDCMENNPCIFVENNSLSLRGKLDNAITNIVVLKNMQTLIENNTGILFTGFEEDFGIGAKRFLGGAIDLGNVFVLNMDVTKRYRRLASTDPIFEIPDTKYHRKSEYELLLGPRRFERLFSFDDSIVFSSAKCDVISYCIQTYNNMHSTQCETDIMSFYEYDKTFCEIVKILASR